MSSPWLEKLSLETLSDDKAMLKTQLAATKWSAKMQFYRVVSSPRSTRKLLEDMKVNDLIWLNDASFLVLKKLPKSVPFFSKFRKASTSIDIAQKSVYVYGISDNFAAAAVHWVLSLFCRSEIVRIGHQYNRATDPLVPTNFISPQFLTNFVQRNPQSRLVLGRGCCLSNKQSVTLASHTEPLRIGLECMFEDWGRTFVETLTKRETTFGELFLHRDLSFDNLYSKYSSFRLIPEIVSEVSQISLVTTTRILERSQYLVPLSAPARRLEYTIWDQVRFEETEPFTVVPKAVTLVFTRCLPARFHTLFLQASGDLQEMGLVHHASHPPSATQQAEILEAIAKNQNLRRLEIGCPSLLENVWHELLETIGSHGSLRTIVFSFRRSFPKYQLERVVAFMKVHDRLDVSFVCRNGPLKGLLKPIDALVRPVRLRNRARALTRESPHVRPAVFGTALTNWAGRKFSRTSLLMSENVAVLCLLIGHSPASRRRGKRQREFIIPELTQQKKLATRDT